MVSSMAAMILSLFGACIEGLSAISTALAAFRFPFVGFQFGIDAVGHAD